MPKATTAVKQEIYDTLNDAVNGLIGYAGQQWMRDRSPQYQQFIDTIAVEMDKLVDALDLYDEDES